MDPDRSPPGLDPAAAPPAAARPGLDAAAGLPAAARPDLDSALQRWFGFRGFRPGQREACEAALAGRDVLVVMPTGSGKSLCYQLPALLRDEVTIVVSPLVALMQDQVDALHARGLADRVALVNAQQDASTNAQILDQAVGGGLRLLYVAPERFSSPGFVERLAGARVGLFVVDEAHCVSQWGHDFRPDYFRLADAARRIGAEAILASTATATPQVAADVVRRLGLREPLRVTTGFDRPNLAFAVARPAAHEKHALAVAALRREDALPAIVYAGTRKGAEGLAKELGAELGVRARHYHAGLEREERAKVQRDFMRDEVEVVVATNAFGMGVDKPNVRTVLHTSVPSSLEAYYQEAGRAGRDGAPARALLLAENRDKALHVHFIRRDELNEQHPERLAAALEAAAGSDGSLPGMADPRYDVDARGLASAAGCTPDQLAALIGCLARAGVIVPSPAPPDRAAGRIAAAFDGRARSLCRSSIADAARARWRQYREVWAYVEGSSCRRRTILRHFGDAAEPDPDGPCCDVCLDAAAPGGGHAAARSTAAAAAPLVPELPKPDRAEAIATLDEAIMSVARSARPAVGRTTCAEIIHGARTKKIERNAYDGLPAYGTSSDMRRADILERIDQLIEQRLLETTGGPYPVLRAPAAPPAAAPPAAAPPAAAPPAAGEPSRPVAA
ncbi:MAG TPA: ATP-dependent DNA helicase RecQ [Thermoleophilaceae bacterium]